MDSLTKNVKDFGTFNLLEIWLLKNLRVWSFFPNLLMGVNRG